MDECEQLNFSEKQNSTGALAHDCKAARVAQSRLTNAKLMPISGFQYASHRLKLSPTELHSLTYCISITRNSIFYAYFLIKCTSKFKQPMYIAFKRALEELSPSAPERMENTQRHINTHTHTRHISCTYPHILSLTLCPTSRAGLESRADVIFAPVVPT